MVTDLDVLEPHVLKHFDYLLTRVGSTLLSRTHLKRPIMAVEECHANKKKILVRVQT